MGTVILPGSTVGVLGGGQLGRMLALTARRMGYRVHVYAPEGGGPAGQVADAETVAAYDDRGALERFAAAVDVVTLEFENIPADALAVIGAGGVPVRPGPQVLRVAQHRLREKTFFAGQGLPVAPFRRVTSLAELNTGLSELGLPAVLKTAGFGYDGKGQVKLERPEQVLGTWAALGESEAVLEAFVPFARELSVVAARGLDGSFVHYGVFENIHRSHILDLTLAPADLPGGVAEKAVALCRTVMEALEVVGVLCLELFMLTDGSLLVNELAPRPHNSGHLTLDACVTSQFENQLRAICGLPLGDPRFLQPAAMANLLGDLWQDGEPDWAAALKVPGVALHLYGKAEARPGRKMGHLTALAPTVAEARAKAERARAALLRWPAGEAGAS
jgi:5-(carboxyamino)imidazole ribonucleotide synthase